MKYPNQSRNVLRRAMHPFSGPELRTWAKIYAYDNGKLHPFSCRLVIRGGSNVGEWRTEQVTVYAFSNVEEAIAQHMDAAKYNGLIDEKRLRAIFHEMINLSTYDELRSMYEICTGLPFQEDMYL